MRAWLARLVAIVLGEPGTLRLGPQGPRGRRGA